MYCARDDSICGTGRRPILVVQSNVGKLTYDGASDRGMRLEKSGEIRDWRRNRQAGITRCLRHQVGPGQAAQEKERCDHAERDRRGRAEIVSPSRRRNEAIAKPLPESPVEPSDNEKSHGWTRC
jgi:hypothetical protein